jgi:hypothetical protein
MGSYTALPDLTTGDLVTEAWIDGARNNADYLLNPNHAASPQFGFLTTTATTFTTVAGSSGVITAHGGPLLATFNVMGASGAGGQAQFDLTVDGASVSTNSGVYSTLAGQASQGVALPFLVTGLASGAHTLAMMYRAGTPGGTAALTGFRHFAVIEL